MGELEAKSSALHALRRVRVALYRWQVRARIELDDAIEIIEEGWSTESERREIRLVDTSSLGGCTARVAPAS